MKSVREGRVAHAVRLLFSSVIAWRPVSRTLDVAVFARALRSLRPFNCAAPAAVPTVDFSSICGLIVQ